MSQDRSELETHLGRGPRLWPWLVAGGLSIAALAGYHILRVPAPLPPPPLVNTAGFDPVIAAAIAQAREAIQSAPHSAEARGRMGMVLLAHDIQAPAGECFEQASVLAPQEPRWLYLLGLAQLAGNPAAASTNFERAVRLFPTDQVAPRLKLAEALAAAGRTTEAEAQYRAILERASNCLPARLGLGKVLNARGQTAEAAQALAGATQDPCTRKAAHRLLVNVYQRLGRTKEAEQLAQVLSGLPADEPYDDPYLADVQALKTGQAAWIDRGDEWIKAGRLVEAAALLEKTVATYTNSDRAMFLLGRARYRLGDLPGAEAMLQQSTQLAPGSVEAQIQLGIVELARGRNEEAQRAFKGAIQAKPNLAQAWFNLGLSLGNSDRAGAVSAFREAIRLRPNFGEAYLALAMVLRSQGQNQAAADELQHALSLNPDEPLRQKLRDQLKLVQGK